MYVAVTSYDPLVIYLYQEGLARLFLLIYLKENQFIPFFKKICNGEI